MVARELLIPRTSNDLNPIGPDALSQYPINPVITWGRPAKIVKRCDNLPAALFGGVPEVFQEILTFQNVISFIGPRLGIEIADQNDRQFRFQSLDLSTNQRCRLLPGQLDLMIKMCVQ